MGQITGRLTGRSVGQITGRIEGGVGAGLRGGCGVEGALKANYGASSTERITGGDNGYWTPTWQIPRKQCVKS